jgi:hypothetical protein
MSAAHARPWGVLALALAVVVTQLHPVPVQVEPPEAVAVRSFIDDHLVSIEGFNAPRRVRQGNRTFNVEDDDFPSAFQLVPEAHTLAKSVQENYRSGMRLFLIGTVIELTGAVTAALLPLIMLSALSPTAVLGIALGAAVVTLAGLIISFVGLPALVRSQWGMYDLISTYNHGLTRRPITVLPAAPQPAAVAPVLQLSI